MSATEARLAEIGLTLPVPAAPVANYVPFVRTGALVFVSGQVSLGPDGLATGHLTGADNDAATGGIARGQAAARLCAINLIAQVKAACGGDLDRVRRVVKLTGFVNCSDGFGQIPEVVNGASDLFVEVFGRERGSHARAAVGAPALPRGVLVEVEGVFETD